MFFQRTKMENFLLAAAAGAAGAFFLSFFSERKIRIGHGWDLHVFGNSGKPLIIGGIEISKELQIVANSDGDVVFHALTDAILGAAGFPDITAGHIRRLRANLFGPLFAKDGHRAKGAGTKAKLAVLEKDLTDVMSYLTSKNPFWRDQI